MATDYPPIIVVDRSVLRIEVGTVPAAGGAAVGPDGSAIEALTGTGIACRTADDTWALRQVANGGGLTITNPAGVAGNITVTLDAGLLSLAGVDTAADLLPYTTGASTWAGSTLSAYARTLLDDADAATARATLGVGPEVLAALVTPGATTTDNVTGVTSGLSFALTEGLWLIEGSISCTSNLTTTGIQFSWAGTNGLVVGECDFSWITYSGVGSSFTSSTPGLAQWSTATSGPGATSRPAVVSGIVRVTTAGTLTLWIRSEVSGAAVTAVRGGLRATKLE